MIFNNSLLLMSAEDSGENLINPIVFGNIIASVDNFLVKLDGDLIRLSEDSGETFTRELDVSVVDVVKYIHLFQDGEILLCGNQKAYYSNDWEQLNESTVLDVNGNLYTPSPVDNFSAYKKTSDRQIVDGKELLCWGNYSTVDGIQFDNINVWYTIDKGQTIRSCFKFGESIPGNRTEPLLARHAHNVDFNPADQTFWLQTGDEPTTRDSHWVKGVYDTINDIWDWNVVGSGDNFKTSNIIWYGDYMYYAWDISQGGVARVPYKDAGDTSKHELVFATPNDCIGIFIGERGDMVAYITKWGGVKKASTLYYSQDLETFHEIEGVLPPELDYHDTLYYNQWRVNSKGKLLAGVLAENVTLLSDWDKTPSIWIDEVIKNAGFPNALKPYTQTMW